MKKIIFITFILSFSSLNILPAQDNTTNFQEAQQLNNRGNFSEAIPILEKLISNDNKNYEYYMELAYSFLNLFEFDQAIANYSKAIELNKDCAKCYSFYARAEYENANLEKAEDIVNQGIKINSNEPNLYMTRGLIYSKTDRNELALNDFHKAIELNPEEKDYYISRANFYIQNSELHNAYSDISKAIKLSPNTAEYYYYRAYILTSLNIQDEALIDINKAIDLNNKEVNYYNLKSTILLNWGKLEEAEDVIYQSLELEPNDYNAYLALTEIYIALNNFDKFCEIADETINLCSVEQTAIAEKIKHWKTKFCTENQLAYYIARALGSFANNNYGNAIFIAKNGIEKIGGSCVLYNVLGSAYLARKEYNLAKTELDSSLNFNNNALNEVFAYYANPISTTDAENLAESYIIRTHFGLAIIYLTKNNYTSALSNILTAINKAEKLEHFSGLELLYITKGLIHLGKNELNIAENSFKIAQEKNPYNPMPRVNLALLDMFKASNFKINKLKFDYEAELGCPRLILPDIKTSKKQNTELLNSALEQVSFACEMKPKNPFLWLYKSKIQQIIGDDDYCNSAQKAKDNGYLDVYKELKIDCK